MMKQIKPEVFGVNVTWVPYVQAKPEKEKAACSMIEKLVLRRIDGRRTVAQILELFPGQHEALRALSTLLQNGTVQVLRTEPDVTPEAPPLVPRMHDIAQVQAAPVAEPPLPAAGTATPEPLKIEVEPLPPVTPVAPVASSPAVPAGEPPVGEDVMQQFRLRLTAQTGPVSRLLLRDAFKACGSDGEQFYPSQVPAFGEALLQVSPASCKGAIEALLADLKEQVRA